MGAVDVINALNQPTQKLIDAVSGAIGKVYEPRYKKKMADAEAYEIEKIGKAIRDNCDMPITYNPDGTLQIDTSNYEELIKRTGLRLAFQEVKKQENIETVVDNAYQLLEQETVVSNEPVDNGWMSRFMNSVGDVSNKDLQELWAKILAEEIKQPDSVSLRTLNVLSNLSKQEAELFMKYCPFVLVEKDGNFCIIKDREIEKTYNIKFDDIFKLDECGLLSCDSGIYTGIEKAIDNTTILYGKEFEIMAKSIDMTLIDNLIITIYPLTECGKQLYQVINSITNKQYLYDIVEKIKINNPNFDINLQFID